MEGFPEGPKPKTSDMLALAPDLFVEVGGRSKALSLPFQ